MQNKPEKNKPAGAFSDPNLIKRIVSALVLAPLILYITYLGGLVFIALFVLIGILIIWEWNGLYKGHWSFKNAFQAIPYAFIAALCPIILRESILGLAVMAWLFFLVWGTDCGAYFAGRTLGGPKLWPAVSPNKTWSGALGGVLVGVGASVYVVTFFGVKISMTLIILSVVASILSQIGDLYESSLKRFYDVKDSSNLIPGHGGVMDRLDGFIFAAGFAAAVGLLVNKSAPAQGFLVW